jgi:hypothetical protein
MTNTFRQIRGILIFYRSFLVPSIIITIFCCVAVIALSVSLLRDHEHYYGIFAYFPQNFLIKSITNILIVIYLLNFKSNELYFYYNLSVSKVYLWIFTFAIDYLVLVFGFFISGFIVKFIAI